jgi:hypothetical protein
MAEDIRQRGIAERANPAPAARPTPPPSLGQRMEVIEDRLKNIETTLHAAILIESRVAALEWKVQAIEERVQAASDFIADLVKQLKAAKIRLKMPPKRAKPKGETNGRENQGAPERQPSAGQA